MGVRLNLSVLILVAYLVSGCGSKKPGVVNPSVKEYPPVAVTKSNATKLYVHYMPWFEDKASGGTGKWGMHWTMSTKNPDITDATGKRQIASYFYPLIGPYASGDKDVIEYHLLLMKYAGIDGVIVDWYGSYDLNDYAGVRRNTEALVKMLEKVGLKFSIAYEDRTTENIVRANLAGTKADALKSDMRYLASNFFNRGSYVTVGGKPLLLVFGPAVITKEADWTQGFSVLSTRPCFLTLWNQKDGAGANASGEFAWVYQSNAALDDFYANRMPTLGVSMGAAYPGFVDFYKEGGWGSPIGWTIAHNNGTTLDETLQKAANAKVSMIQLVTWNDFGEGTIIEPTLEFGFSYLEKIGLFAGTGLGVGAYPTIYKLYQLRKKYAANEVVQQQLNQAFYYLVSLQQEQAQKTLDNVEKSAAVN